MKTSWLSPQQRSTVSVLPELYTFYRSELPIHFFSVRSKRTNEKHATSWNHGNIALFVLIFPSQMNVYAAIIWHGSVTMITVFILADTMGEDL